MNPRWNRWLAKIAAGVFLISSIFPLAAGFVRDTSKVPKIWGQLDVAIAFVLCLLMIAVLARGNSLVTEEIERITYRAYRSLIHVIFLMLVVFFVAGDWIKWIQCLTGFAWRAWILLYALPQWIALRSDRDSLAAANH